MTYPTEERNMAIVAERESGELLRVIGARHGLSAERIRQIVAKHYRRIRSAQIRKEREERLQDMANKLLDAATQDYFT